MNRQNLIDRPSAFRYSFISRGVVEVKHLHADTWPE